jgi:hypothetical protein
MDIFICWSGEASKKVAEGLRDLLSRVIQASKPFLSSEDIRKGQRWNAEISARLANTHFGVLCMTSANIQAPWIHFEAGALSKNIAVGRVTALLVDIKAAEMKEPLSQFQHTDTSHDEVFKLISDINASMDPDKQLRPDVVKDAFDQNWPKFETIISTSRDLLKKGPKPAPKARDNTDMLEEIVSVVRDIQKAVASASASNDRLKKLSYYADNFVLNDGTTKLGDYFNSVIAPTSHPTTVSPLIGGPMSDPVIGAIIAPVKPKPTRG